MESKTAHSTQRQPQVPAELAYIKVVIKHSRALYEQIGALLNTNVAIGRYVVQGALARACALCRASLQEEPQADGQDGTLQATT